MPNGRKATPLAISMDEETLQLIDQIAAARADSRSAIMRAAIRAGLPLVQSGERVEMVPADAALQEDVANVAKWKGWSRGRTLNEAVKIGLPAVNARYPNVGDSPTPDEADVFALIARMDPQSNPLLHDLRRERNEASYWRSFVHQVRQLSDGEKAVERVERVHRWIRKAGKPFVLSHPGVSMIPMERFLQLEAEALADEVDEPSANASRAPDPIGDGGAPIGTASATARSSATARKPRRKPAKE